MKTTSRTVKKKYPAGSKIIPATIKARAAIQIIPGATRAANQIPAGAIRIKTDSPILKIMMGKGETKWQTQE